MTDRPTDEDVEYLAQHSVFDAERVLAAEVREHRATIARVRALHVLNPLSGQPRDGYCNNGATCSDCLDNWPCDTIKALDGDQ